MTIYYDYDNKFYTLLNFIYKSELTYVLIKFKIVIGQDGLK